MLGLVPAATKAIIVSEATKIFVPEVLASPPVVQAVVNAELGSWLGFDWINTETIRRIPWGECHRLGLPYAGDSSYCFFTRFLDPDTSKRYERRIYLNRLGKSPSDVLNISNGLEIPGNAIIEKLNVFSVQHGTSLAARQFEL